MEKKFDFIISGGGLVGCILASELSKLNFNCCIIEKNKFELSRKSNNINPLSLNYRSRIILEKLKLWNLLKSECNPISELTLKHFNNLSRVKFQSNDINLRHLGYIFDRNFFQNTLRKNILDNKKITILDNTTVKDITHNKTNNNITLSQIDQRVSSKYVIVCDTSESSLVKFVCNDVEKINYNQTSLIISAEGTFTASSAVQYFTKYGVLAVLPHSSKTASLVLTIKDEFLSEFITDDSLKDQNIVGLFKNYTEKLSLKSLVGQYSMKTSRAKSLLRNNVILFGNSSHLIHTIGAQGYNLALRNVEAFIEYFSEKQIKDNNSLNKLVNKIDQDRHDVFDNIDFVLSMFLNDSPISKLLSKSIITSLKLYPGLKNKFLKKIIGLEKYPYLSAETI